VSENSDGVHFGELGGLMRGKDVLFCSVWVLLQFGCALLLALEAANGLKCTPEENIQVWH
jgi:hypothetical protein